MAAVGVRSESKAGSAQTEEEARLEEEAAKKQASLLNKIFFYLLMFFSSLVGIIIGIAGFIVRILINSISYELLTPFTGELLQLPEIQFFLRKLLVYDDSAKYGNLPSILAKQHMQDNYRIFFVTSRECKEKGLRHLIEILQGACADEIEFKARLYYKKEVLKDSELISKREFALTFVALTFIITLPLLVIYYILLGTMKALKYFPDRLTDDSPIFEQARDERLDEQCQDKKDRLIINKHEELIVQLFKNGIIDELAKIRYKAISVLGEDCDSIKEKPPNVLKSRQDQFEITLVKRILDEIDESTKKSTKWMISLSSKIIAIDEGNAPCKLACCAGRNGMQA